MAVNTTPEDIFVEAYALHEKFTADKIATEDTELFNLVVRSLRGIYSVAARINPFFFGTTKTEAAPGASSPWPMPEGAQAIAEIQDGSGNEIVPVHFKDRDMEPAKASVYFFGQAFYSPEGTNDPDPATDSITYWYSKRPADPASKTAALDSMWLEDYNQLLIHEVAIYLAAKSELEAVARAMMGERDHWLRMFVSDLEGLVPYEKSRAESTPFMPRVVPIGSLVAGGTEVLG